MEKYKLSFRRYKFDDDTFITDVKRVALHLKKTTLSTSDYDTNGKHNSGTLSRRFGSWSRVLELSGLQTGRKCNISDEELLSNLVEVWAKLGMQPRRRELRVPISKFSESPYIARWGTWKKALENFVEWANHSEDELAHENINDSSLSIRQHFRVSENNKIDSRNVRPWLKYSVFVRDGFRCQSCGKSPITHPGIELQVDHKIPYSLGGRTIKENLVTKCAECNLGKGNRCIE